MFKQQNRSLNNVEEKLSETIYLKSELTELFHIGWPQSQN